MDLIVQGERAKAAQTVIKPMSSESTPAKV
jgi:hypothetical protein